jgi:ribonuclease T2
MTKGSLMIVRCMLAAALLAPAPALAQAYSCTVPDKITLPPPARPDGGSLRTAIGGYTLAVSWSPEFCRGKRGAEPDNMQCNGKNGRFGFVLHGLWPDAPKGPPPQWCALEPRPTEADHRANLCRTPVPWLIEHEWAKHGSCMASTPAGYFKVAGILWDSLRLPDADGLSRREGLTAGDLRRAFVLNNPGWKKEAVGVQASNGGWLRELYLCLDRKFRPTACSKRNFGPKDAAPLKIWRGL